MRTGQNVLIPLLFTITVTYTVASLTVIPKSNNNLHINLMINHDLFVRGFLVFPKRRQIPMTTYMRTAITKTHTHTYTHIQHERRKPDCFNRKATVVQTTTHYYNSRTGAAGTPVSYEQENEAHQPRTIGDWKDITRTDTSCFLLLHSVESEFSINLIAWIQPALEIRLVVMV